MGKAQFKRKQILIKKGFQFAYVGKILLLELIAVATTALLMSYLFLFVFNESSLVSSGPWGAGLLWSTVALTLILMAILFWLGIRISHKIAGPMYRFEQVFNDIQEGNFNSRVYLRDGDEMQPLAKTFNAMMDVILEHKKQHQTGEFNAETIDKKLMDVVTAIDNSGMDTEEKEKYQEVVTKLKDEL